MDRSKPMSEKSELSALLITGLLVVALPLVVLLVSGVSTVVLFFKSLGNQESADGLKFWGMVAMYSFGACVILCPIGAFTMIFSSVRLGREQREREEREENSRRFDIR